MLFSTEKSQQLCLVVTRFKFKLALNGERQLSVSLKHGKETYINITSSENDHKNMVCYCLGAVTVNALYSYVLSLALGVARNC